MTAILLDGKAISSPIRAEIKEQVADFTKTTAAVPTLAAVLVGNDPASEIYVRNKRRSCERIGITSQMHRLPASTSQEELLKLVNKLNRDDGVHGILVQLPLPEQIDTTPVLDAIDPLKDVDAFHPENVGRIAQDRPRFLPCTPHGIQQMLQRNDIQIAGRHVVVVGRSEIVGKPMAMMLMQRRGVLGPSYVNATVTVCHSRTRDLGEVTRQADILIVAIGSAKLIKADMVKPGAVVVDVGMNRTEEGLVGDVDFAAVQHVAGYITPVPGGVGPLTVTMLLYNTLAAARLQTT